MSFEHVDYPHVPGTLYDCPACETECACDQVEPPCLACALLGEAQTTMLLSGVALARDGTPQLWHFGPVTA